MATWNITVDGKPDIKVQVIVPAVANGTEKFETPMNHRLPTYLSRG